MRQKMACLSIRVSINLHLAVWSVFGKLVICISSVNQLRDSKLLYSILSRPKGGALGRKGGLKQKVGRTGDSY